MLETILANLLQQDGELLEENVDMEVDPISGFINTTGKYIDDYFVESLF